MSQTEGGSFQKQEVKMPMIRIQTSNAVADKPGLAKAVSAAAREATGKPECYVQLIVEDQVYMMLGGEDSPSAMVELRAIGGLSHPVCEKFSRLICEILKERQQISPDRVYINFMEFDASKWGWNSGTF